MTAALEQVRLLYASIEAGVSPQRDATIDRREPFAAIEVPGGVSFLQIGEECNSPSLVRERPDEQFAYAIIQPCRRGLTSKLILANPRRLPIRVNGRIAPLVSALREGDEILVNSRMLLFVTIFRRPFVGAADDTVAGKTCPMCQLPIAAGCSIYFCPHCETALHCQGDETPEADRLQCARLSDSCPACSSRIAFEEGYSYWPEDAVHG